LNFKSKSLLKIVIGVSLSKT